MSAFNSEKKFTLKNPFRTINKVMLCWNTDKSRSEKRLVMTILPEMLFPIITENAKGTKGFRHCEELPDEKNRAERIGSRMKVDEWYEEEE